MTRTNTGFGAVLTLALAAGLVACEGPAGPAGADGSDGADGIDGAAGADGGDGGDGADGADGATGPAGPPGGVDPALATWDKVLAGIGGEAALAGLAGFTIEAAGDRWVGGEGYDPNDGSHLVSSFALTVRDDRAEDALRYDWDRTLSVWGGAPQLYSEIVTGDVGYVDGIDSLFGSSTGDMPSSRWAAAVKQHRLLNPHLVLLDVLADPTLATEAAPELFAGVMHEVLVVDDAVAPIVLYVQPNTGHIARLVTLENHHLLRDVTLEAQYAAWQSFGAGPLFPEDVSLLLDGEMLHREQRTSVTLGAPAAGSFDLPTGAAPVYDAALAEFGERTHNFHTQFASIGLPFDLPQTFVAATELAPGVFHLTGGTHHSLVVEQDDGLVVVEAPLYPERADAILAWAAAQLPTKPVTHVIATHHHLDHSAGLRSFVAAGATVVTSAHNETLLREVFRAASTIVPDALAAAPVTPVFLTVPDNGTVLLDDPQNPVVAAHMASSHAEDLLVVHAPATDHVFESDLWNPGPGGGALVPTFAVELRGFLDGWLGGAPTLVGGHGGVGPYEELTAYVDAL